VLSLDDLLGKLSEPSTRKELDARAIVSPPADELMQFCKAALELAEHIAGTLRAWANFILEAIKGSLPSISGRVSNDPMASG
jgi:hypothetical protein